MNFSSGFFDSLMIAISAPKIVPKKTVIAASFKVSHKPLMKMPEFSWKTWMTPGDFFATPSEPSNSMPSLEASVLASFFHCSYSPFSLMSAIMLLIAAISSVSPFLTASTLPAC